MVECVRTDGLRFIEFVGHDPCRIPEGTSHSLNTHDSRQISLSTLQRSEDPCEDVFLNKLTNTRISISSAISLRILPCYLLGHSPRAVYIAIIDNGFNPASKLPPKMGSDASSAPNLRI